MFIEFCYMGENAVLNNEYIVVLILQRMYFQWSLNHYKHFKWIEPLYSIY